MILDNIVEADYFLNRVLFNRLAAYGKFSQLKFTTVRQ